MVIFDGLVKTEDIAKDWTRKNNENDVEVDLLTFKVTSSKDSEIHVSILQITTMFQAYSIVYQLFMALAVAEYRLSFEHRDLNCGNILISNVDWHDMIRFNFRKHASPIS